MLAIKRPIPIEVEEFQPERYPWPRRVVPGNGDYAGSYVVYNAIHDVYIQIKPGDYVNVSDEKDVYPIARATFERTYDIVKD